MHRRDVTGFPASHDCIGLCDESMQKEEYGIVEDPELNDAKRQFEWVLEGEVEDEKLIQLPQGSRVHIIDRATGHPKP